MKVANAAAAKRLRDDELPTRANTLEFLRTARLREVKLQGVKTLSPAELKVRVASR